MLDRAQEPTYPVPGSAILYRSGSRTHTVPPHLARSQSYDGVTQGKEALSAAAGRLRRVVLSPIWLLLVSYCWYHRLRAAPSHYLSSRVDSSEPESAVSSCILYARDNKVTAAIPRGVFDSPLHRINTRNK